MRRVNGLVLHQNGDHAAPKVNVSEPEEVRLEPATLAGYVGRYRFGSGAVLEVALKGDRLEAQLTGQPPVPIFASARDTFFTKIVEARLDFARDAGGRVAAVVLHQNGRDLRAARIPAR